MQAKGFNFIIELEVVTTKGKEGAKEHIKKFLLGIEDLDSKHLIKRIKLNAIRKGKHKSLDSTAEDKN